MPQSFASAVPLLTHRSLCDGAAVRAGRMGVSVGWAGGSKSLVWHVTPTNEYWRDTLKDKFGSDDASVMTLLNLSQLILNLGRCHPLWLQGGWGAGGWVLLLGGGKSKTLGACSMLLNLLGFRVSCMCYAE